MPAQAIKILVKNNNKLKEIFITPQGIEPPVRSVRDGVVYFGCKRKDLKKKIVVDYVTNILDKNLCNQYRGPHFMIYFDLNDSSYYLQDLVIGFGTFIKILKPLALENNYLINIGDAFILINLILKSSSDDFPRLRLKVFESQTSPEIFYFNAQDFCLNNIILGRSKKSNVSINDNMVSKYHAIVYFASSKTWIIEDGNGAKKSTNGTWLYASQDTKLCNGMEFKACDSIFKIIS